MTTQAPLSSLILVSEMHGHPSKNHYIWVGYPEHVSSSEDFSKMKAQANAVVKLMKQYDIGKSSIQTNQTGLEAIIEEGPEAEAAEKRQDLFKEHQIRIEIRKYIPTPYEYKPSRDSPNF